MIWFSQLSIICFVLSNDDYSLLMICGRVGNYAAKCPHDKGKMYVEGNISYYTHDDGDGMSNSDEYDQ